jgi:hypothetical protein
MAFAERLKASTRPGETVSRLGGDEFALLLESGDMPGAAQLAAGRIAEALKSPIHIGAEDISVQTSIGIAVDQPPYEAPIVCCVSSDRCNWGRKNPLYETAHTPNVVRSPQMYNHVALFCVSTICPSRS